MIFLLPADSCLCFIPISLTALSVHLLIPLHKLELFYLPFLLATLQALGILVVWCCKDIISLSRVLFSWILTTIIIVEQICLWQTVFQLSDVHREATVPLGSWFCWCHPPLKLICHNLKNVKPSKNFVHHPSIYSLPVFVTLHLNIVKYKMLCLSVCINHITY